MGLPHTAEPTLCASISAYGELEASGVGDGVQGKDLLLHMHLDQPDLSV